MDFDVYLKQFKKAASRVDKSILRNKNLKLDTGITLDSVFLKLYKLSWTSDVKNPLEARSRIFFSIWVNDSTIEAGKIFYNIHALKLRDLNGYSIASRTFAEKFRKRFKSYLLQWPNASTEFGPLTLMEGWVSLNQDEMVDSIETLANEFCTMDFLVDDTLKEFEKSLESTSKKRVTHR